MLKVIIIIALVTLGLAQESTNDSPSPQNENITKLDLSKQGLTSLNDYDFSKYPQIEEIDLSDNDLLEIKEDKFLNNTKLQSINLSGNKHLEFPRFSTIFISNIAILNISNCDIKTLPQHIFDGLRYLKTIDLSNNPLRSKGFRHTPFNAIESLEKIILPVENKALLKEVCLNSNVSIEIISKDQHNLSVKCSDYVNYEDSSQEEESEEENNPVQNLLVKPEIPQKETSKLQENNDQVKPEEKKVDDDPSAASLPETSNEHATNNQIIPDKPPVSNLIETSQENGTNPEPTTNTTDKDGSHHNKAKLEPRVDAQLNTNNNVVISGGNAGKPEDVNTTKTVATNIAVPLNVNKTNATELNQPQYVVLNSSNAVQTNKSEKMQQAGVDEEGKVGTSTTQASNTGSTILIVLVVLVVVAGLAAFGYKFYKNRTQSGSETVDRELKEIVVNSKANRPETSSQDFVEKEPLMNNHVTKENGDAKGNQSSSKDDSIENSLNAHVGPVNTLNTASPYKPTTFKPEDSDVQK